MKKFICMFMSILLLSGCGANTQNDTTTLPEEKVVSELPEEENNEVEQVNEEKDVIELRYGTLTTQQKINILSLKCLVDNPNRYIMVGPNCASADNEDAVFVRDNMTYTNIYYNPNIPMSADVQNELYLACDWYGVNYYIMIGLIEEECIFDENYQRVPGYTVGYFQLEDDEEHTVYNVTTNIWLGVERFSNYLTETEDIETAVLYFNEGVDDGFVDRVMHYAYAWGYNYDTSEGYYDEVLGDVAVIED